MKVIKSLTVLLICVLLSACGDKISQTVIIKPDGNKMKYETTSFKVKAGTTIRVVMDNTADVPVMKHNIVFLTEKRFIKEVGEAASSAPNNIPDNPAIIAYTPIADPESETEVVFKVPSTPGSYPYICTYPGHYLMMQGTMIVE